MKEIEDVYGESTVELVRALDDFDVNSGVQFVTFAYKYMENRMFELYTISHDDAITHIQELEVIDLNDNFLEDGFFTFLYDKYESDIQNQIADKDLVEDILRFINRLDDEEEKIIIKMSLGIDCDRKYTRVEIAEIIGKSKSLVSRKYLMGIRKLQEYIASQYELSLPDIHKKYSRENIKFTSRDDRNIYIFNSYFGLNNCKKKNVMELAYQLDLSADRIRKIILDVVNGLSQEERDALNLDEIKLKNRKSKYGDDVYEQIFYEYYGLNGYHMISSDEILAKHNIADRNILFSLIYSYRKGRYSQEEVEKLEEKRRIFRLKKNIIRWRQMYLMYNGLNGYEKRSQFQIAKEFGVTQQSVYSSLCKFKAYLDSLPNYMQEEALLEDGSIFIDELGDW